MSTQITYKGSTIASFSNDTKTLNTAGKYMEGDVAVTESISLQSKSVIPTTTSQTITADSGYEGLGTVTVGAVDNSATIIWDEEDSHGGTIRHIETGNVVSGITNITTNGLHTVASFYSASVNVVPTLQSKSATPSETAQTITPDSNYDGLSQVSVGAISSTYVGTGIPQRSSSDLTTSGATVNVPSGYYESQASKSVASGTAGTPTATKGTVSNHSVSVTPSVTNTTGYITGSTKTGTAVTVSASELVSGTKSITENGTGIDVTNYASVDVEIPGSLNTYIIELTNSGSAYDYIAYNNVQYYTAGDIIEVNEGDIVTVSVSSGYESNSIYLNDTVVKSSFHNVSYNYTATSNVKVSFSFPTNAAKAYLSEVSDVVPLSITENGTYTASGATRGYSPVTVSVPSPSGTYNITSNGIYDVTNFASASVSVAGGGGGITVDDIAMRTISGDIFGNATSIGDYAFYSCTSLTTANFPNATYIGNSAFAYCINLTTASFPSVTSIGSYTFAFCSNLTTASFPNATSISVYAFYSCTSLTTANFPNVTYIGGYAFFNCSSLTTVSFPSATYIGNSAFYCCSNLTTASFPSVTSIGVSAFYSCRSLTTANFPNATSIGVSAFYSCRSLTTISFPNVTYIGGSAFYNCTSLTTVSFPNATSIGGYAFFNCSSLTTVSFPSVTSIGNSAFAYCYSLTEANFPELTAIGSYAFQYCRSLTTASFPKATVIKNYAFRSCYHLLSLYLLGSSFCSLDGTSAFYSCPISDYTTSTGGVHGNIFVPASLYDTYISAQNWFTMSNRFVSLTDAEIEALSD